MNLSGKKVIHTKFGAGTIVSQSSNRIEVHFKESTKLFIYPDAFEHNFSVQDKNVEEYIHSQLFQVQENQKAIQHQKNEERKQETERNAYRKKIRIPVNSQAVFGMLENKAEQVLEDWCIFTGKNVSGAHTGSPRIPKNLNANSACLITMKPEGASETERIILGMFLPAENFIGAMCKDGTIYAHDKYRIVWDPDQEDLLFWNYVPETSRLQKWGKSEMKYIPNTVIKSILDDMLQMTEGTDSQEHLTDFYQYFCDINNL